MKKFLQDIHLWLFLALISFLVTGINGCAGRSKSIVRESVSEGEVVEAEGMAPMTDDLAGVRKASLADSQRVAVEKVVGVLVSGKTLVEKATMIEQHILAQSAGYVKKYEVIKEWQKGGYYYTRIKALVSYQKVWADLDKMAILHSPVVGNPRVAILINEPTLSNTLAQGLTRQGYRIVDSHNSEIVITGEVSTETVTSPELSGLISIRGILAARALKPKTGEVLSSISIQASGADFTEKTAHQKAMTLLGEKASENLSESLTSLLASRPTVSLIVRGITSFATLVKLKDTLTKIVGNDNIFVRSYSEGAAEIEINTPSVTSTDLANVLSKKGWQIISQTHNTIEIKSK